MSKHVVYRVDSVTADLEKTNPPQLRVTVGATASTPHWTNIELTPYVYVMPPLDGIQDFAIIGEPPSGIVNPILWPVTAHYTMKNLPNWIRGVRIHASSNKMEVLIGQSTVQSGKICVSGTLTNEGVECQALRATSGELYTLVGNLTGLANGDKVYVVGTIAAISFCMQGTTIAVEWISKESPKLR